MESFKFDITWDNNESNGRLFEVLAFVVNPSPFGDNVTVH